MPEPSELDHKLTDPNRAYPLEEILKGMPPGRSYLAVNATHMASGSQGTYNALSTPELEMSCDHVKCQGERYFDCTDDFANKQSIDKGKELFLHYRCRNCRSTVKVFAIYGRHTTGDNAQITKLGEWPPFLPATPPRVIKMLGPDLDLYFRGRRAEAQGLGIGAFAYYRKVVDNQWRRLLDEIERATQRVGGDIRLIQDAKREDQFSKAVEQLKDAIPQAIRLDGGHNPLTLLYSAISHHLHSETDEKCLELARSVRLVLGHLTERLDLILKDKAELDEAVGRLLADSSEPSKSQ